MPAAILTMNTTTTTTMPPYRTIMMTPTTTTPSTAATATPTTPTTHDGSWRGRSWPPWLLRLPTAAYAESTWSCSTVSPGSPSNLGGLEDYEDQKCDEHGLTMGDGPLDPAVDLDCSAFLEIMDDQLDSEEPLGPLFLSNDDLTILLPILRSIADDASGPAAGDAGRCTWRTVGPDGALAVPVAGCRGIAAVSVASHAGRRAALFLDSWLDDSDPHGDGQDAYTQWRPQRPDVRQRL